LSHLICAVNKGGIMSSMHRRAFRRVDKKGRSKGTEKFVMVWNHVLRCDAYRSMKALPRAVYFELRRRFNGMNNGKIHCSIRELANEFHCSKDSATAALAELEEKGFIKCARPGSFNYKIRHAAEWTLTEESLGEEFPTKEFMRWTKPKEKSGPENGTVGPEIRTPTENKDRGKVVTVLKQGPIGRNERRSRS
jgi:hypothetical protein